MPVAPLGLEIDGSYASPPSSLGGCMHGCHRSSSAWASQNHFLHDVQRTVAGYVHAAASGEMPRHDRSWSAPSCSFSPIDTTHLVPPFYARWATCRKSEGFSGFRVYRAPWSRPTSFEIDSLDRDYQLEAYRCGSACSPCHSSCQIAA